MDYKKAYDEAFERANVAHKDEDKHLKATLERIFPELKESEDEKVRGAIIHFISHTPTVPKGTVDKETMLAWLEKQGEQKNKINSYRITFKDILALECAMKTIKITEGGNVLYEMLVHLYNKVHNAYLVEKQCESYTKRDVDDAYLEGICDANHELEKQGKESSWKPSKEQYKASDYEFKAEDWYVSKVDGKIHNIKFIEKPSTEEININKIESKFHEGEWITIKE